MRWDYWIKEYVLKYCGARNLQSSSRKAYMETLRYFKDYLKNKKGIDSPDNVIINDVFDYIDFLRDQRRNSDSTINRHVVVIKNFYKCAVALRLLPVDSNPMRDFPRIKAPKRKVREILTEKEVKRLINATGNNTIVGLRDKAMLTLLYSTGIRASECEKIRDKDIDFENATVTVVGKGGDVRSIPLHKQAIIVLMNYKNIKGKSTPDSPFFKARTAKTMTRRRIYEKVKKYVKKAKIKKNISPHSIRHTFATHMVRRGEGVVVIKELLGHRQLSSTQMYFHLTGEDLRRAVKKHPIGELFNFINDIFPAIKMRFQHPPGTKFAFE